MNLHKLYLPVVVALLLIAALGFVSWFRAHEALHEAALDAKTKEADIRLQQQKIDTAQANEKKANDALDLEKKKPATVETVVRYLPAPLPQGSGIAIGKDAQGKDAVIVSGDTKANLDYIQTQEIECQKCKNSLAARTTELEGTQSQLKSMTQERDDFKKLAKPSFLTKTKEAATLGGCAAGGAWLGSKASGKNGAKGAAIGAVAGFALCKISIRF